MDPKLKSSDRVLVRWPNPVGDAVMATPVLESLRAGLPEARIGVAVRPHLAGVLEGNPASDDLIPCEDTSAAGLRRTAERIRAFAPDAAVLLPNSLRSGLLVRMAGVPRVYGYRRGPRSPLLTGGPSPPRDGRGIRPVPMVAYYLGLCRWLGLETPARPRPRLFVADELVRSTEEYLARRGVGREEMLVGLCPGAGFGPSKCWPPEHFARLAERLREALRCRLILLVGPGEEPIARRIADLSAAPLIVAEPVREGLRRLKALIRRCALLVTNDTGPRHFAAAFDVPAVVLMGPNDPRFTNANLERAVVLRRDLPCSPCLLKVCPSDHACMRGIEPEAVFEAAMGLLTGPGAKTGLAQEPSA